MILLGLEAWKPVLAALLLPPAPLLMLMLLGARLILPRRGLGWLVVVLSVGLLWLSACAGTADLLTRMVLRPPPPLTTDRIQVLKRESHRPAPVIVVLGGGIEPFAPEYGVSNLHHASLERLRYGIWLSRETGLPLAFSGGVGWGQRAGRPEAQVAAQIAAVEFGRPIQWVEDRSRDTHENAVRTVGLLKTAAIDKVIIVTHGWHMARAVREFQAAAGESMAVEAAPMGLARGIEAPSLTWIPTTAGMADVRHLLREIMAGWFAG
jgi:uncharacterized SAM-binding protein YcdF (DUF218 family)